MFLFKKKKIDDNYNHAIQFRTEYQKFYFIYVSY